MKKWLIWLLLILILTFLFVYLFIPAKIVISNISTPQATISGVYRYMSQEEKWDKWWQDFNGKTHVQGEPFQYNKTEFNLIKQGGHAIKIQIKNEGLQLESILRLVTFTVDTTGIYWSFEMPVTNNPFTRIKYYRAGQEIKKDMLGVMKNFTRFISIPKNIYGMEIYRASTRDTTLLSTRFTSPHFPGTTELYKYFGIIETSIRKQNGKKTGFPMMNVVRQDDSTYETQVAIPTDHKLENDGKIVYRYMVPGNFYVGNIRGGQLTVNEAKEQLDQFILDYKKSKMANTFQILVTDRTKEADTSKWMTQLRVPVVQ